MPFKPKVCPKCKKEYIPKCGWQTSCGCRKRPKPKNRCSSCGRMLTRNMRRANAENQKCSFCEKRERQVDNAIKRSHKSGYIPNYMKESMSIEEILKELREEKKE